MNYPNNFYTPIFPESRKIAFSRALAVWTLIAFFVVAALCGLLIWSSRSVHLSPFLISINQTTGEWTIIGENAKPLQTVTAASAMQESVVGNFAKSWLGISKSAEENDANWCKCDRNQCTRIDSGDADARCFLCCSSSEGLYRTFSDDVLPDRRARAESGESWQLAEDSMAIAPISKINDNGGMWRVFGVLESGTGARKNIEAYVRVVRSADTHPLTMGYYVADFNGYSLEKREQ